MNIKILVAAGAGALALAAGAWLWLAPAHGKRAQQGTDRHARGFAPLAAMLDAPDGATPCETAFAAIEAGQKAARAGGMPPMFSRVAERDDFLARCNALPKEAQVCLQPRWELKHRDECKKARPPQATLDQLFTTSASEPTTAPTPFEVLH